MSLYDLFWSENFWLPTNISWQDIEKFKSDGNNFPDVHYFIKSWLICTLFWLFFKKLLDKTLSKYLTKVLVGKRCIRKKPEACQLLEKEYNNLKSELCKKFKNPKYCHPTPNFEDDNTVVPLNWSKYRFNRWYRRRRNQDRIHIQEKMNFVLNVIIGFFINNIIAVYYYVDKEWIYSFEPMINGYPYHHFEYKDYTFYTIYLGFLSAALINLFIEPKKKDFNVTLIHHIITLTLMTMSYAANLVKIGLFIVYWHIPVDWILGLGKVCIFGGFKQLGNLVFIIFVITWFYTRMYVVTKVIYGVFLSVVVKMPIDARKLYIPIDSDTVYPSTVYTTLAIILSCLQLLCVHWSYLILKLVYRKIFIESDTRDNRSDAEEFTSDDEKEKDE